jgi:hypothetical protein
MRAKKPPIFILRCEWCKQLFPWRTRQIIDGPVRCCSLNHLALLRAWERERLTDRVPSKPPVSVAAPVKLARSR